MNKKKLITMLTALSLVAVIGVGATLAYFTDSDAATNVITMGHVDVDLTEPEFDKNPENTDGNHEITNVVPGQVITKDPTITLSSDSEDAYIRAELTFEVTLSEDSVQTLTDQEKTDLIAQMKTDISNSFELNDGWSKGSDGYYYFDTKLSNKDDGVTSTGIFKDNKVTVPTSWNNYMADCSFDIIVSVEAIQADNLAEDFFKEDGTWNISADEILEYQAAPASQN